MENNVIQIKKYQKKPNIKMLLIIIVVAMISAILIWDYYIEEKRALDVQIPPSNNISYNNETAIASTTAQIAQKFQENQGKPILFYIYTTWCGVCKRNFPIINEIAREFQNTDLETIYIAIDRDLNPQKVNEYLNKNGNLYFKPYFLASKEGFSQFLKEKGIKYRGVIPFTALIDRNGKVIMTYKGKKRAGRLKNKIIKQIALNQSE